MNRRDAVLALLALGVVPRIAGAQQPDRMRRVGVLMGFAEGDPVAQAQVMAFRQKLQKLGWTDGSNIRIDLRYATADPNRIRALATELLGLAPDLIVSNSNLVTTILKAEARTIPLVFTNVSDPVGSGFVTDLARPTGNITGFANFEPSMGGKWIELLTKIAPRAKRVGIVLHPETAPNIGFLKAAEAAAPLLKVKVTALGVHNADEIERAVAAFAAQGNGGLVVAPHAVTFSNRDLIVALSARHRLPAIYPFAFYARAGGLISYGFDSSNQFRQAAVYVDKILNGAKPSDLSVQHPTKFELVINLKTAKALGLTIPQSVLLQATEVIE